MDLIVLMNRGIFLMRYLIRDRIVMEMLNVKVYNI